MGGPPKRTVAAGEHSFPCFLLKRDTTGKWHWRYYGADGQELARSSVKYEHVDEVRQSVAEMKASGLSRQYREG
jgi:uncharacterized protein YegP (UPF0339 family)